MAVALDASTPAFVTGTANPATTASFTNPAQSMLFAICEADETNTFVISNPSGSALTWTSVGVGINTAGRASISVFWAYDAAGGTRTVRSTRTGSFTAHALKVLVFTGTETTFTGAKTAAQSDTASLVTTANNSWVYAGLGNENGAIDTPSSGCALNDASTAFGGISGGVLKMNAVTATSGTNVTIGAAGTGDPHSVLAFEVKEGTAGGPTGTTVSGVWPNAYSPGMQRRHHQTSFTPPFQLLGSQDVTTATDYVKSTSDNVGVTDGRVIARGTSAADAVGLTDAVRISLTKGITDAIGVTDTRAYNDGENYTDPIGITDAVTRTVTVNRSPADPVGITDTRAVARGATRTDAVGITDSATGVISLTKTVTDPVGITDTRTTARSKSPGDAVGVTDAVAIAMTRQRAVTDAVGVTDTRSYTDGENQNDPVTITDARTVTRGTSRTDPVGVTDTRGVARGVARSDSVGVTDTRTSLRGKAVTDNVNMTDIATAARSIHVTVSDVIGVTDFIPSGTVRDIRVSLTGGPRVQSRALTGPRLASRTSTGPHVDRAVTGPAVPSLEVESLRAQARLVTGPRSY